MTCGTCKKRRKGKSGEETKDLKSIDISTPKGSEISGTVCKSGGLLNL